MLLVNSPPSTSPESPLTELLNRLFARIFSPFAINRNGTIPKTALMIANTVHDHAIPRLSSILSVASGIRAPAMERVMLAAARADAE
jgi:hypothetical protein